MALGAGSLGSSVCRYLYPVAATTEEPDPPTPEKKFFSSAERSRPFQKSVAGCPVYGTSVPGFLRNSGLAARNIAGPGTYGQLCRMDAFPFPGDGRTGIHSPAHVGRKNGRPAGTRMDAAHPGNCESYRAAVPRPLFSWTLGITYRICTGREFWTGPALYRPPLFRLRNSHRALGHGPIYRIPPGRFGTHPVRGTA